MRTSGNAEASQREQRAEIDAAKCKESKSDYGNVAFARARKQLVVRSGEDHALPFGTASLAAGVSADPTPDAAVLGQTSRRRYGAE